MKKTILLVCLVPTVFVLAENFTIQKKKKKIPSKSTLQQHCCDAGAELIKEFAQILKQIGDMQLILADTMQAYFENNKKHVFMCATKEQLQQQKKNLYTVQRDVEQLQKSLRNFIQSNRTLTVKTIA